MLIPWGAAEQAGGYDPLLGRNVIARPVSLNTRRGCIQQFKCEAAGRRAKHAHKSPLEEAIVGHGDFVSTLLWETMSGTIMLWRMRFRRDAAEGILSGGTPPKRGGTPAE